MDWKVVPIDTWIGEATELPREHPFRRSMGMDHGVDWATTVDLLEKELGYLDAEHIVLRMNVHPFDLRVDGWIRANAKPVTPGVILSFDSMHGPLSYPCDTFLDWQANVRAIALGLKDLRRLERYGITKTGQQYTGWKQLTASASGGIAPHDLIAGWSGWPVDGVRAEPARAFRLARRASHPDSEQGSVDHYKEVVKAGAAIGLG